MGAIRKFVGCVMVSAGLAAALPLGVSAQTLAAHVAPSPATAPGTTAVSVATLAPDCLAALHAIRDALAADRQEDSDELHNPNPSGEAAEDKAETSQFTRLISNLRSACAAQPDELQTAPPMVSGRPAVSAQCLAAVQAWKAFARSLWAQHSAPTAAQLAQLRQLGQAVRTVCGSSWEDWSFRDR